MSNCPHCQSELDAGFNCHSTKCHKPNPQIPASKQQEPDTITISPRSAGKMTQLQQRIVELEGENNHMRMQGIKPGITLSRECAKYAEYLMDRDANDGEIYKQSTAPKWWAELKEALK